MHVYAAEHKVLVAIEGAVPVLLAVLKQHRTNVGVALAAFGALQKISSNGVCSGLTLCVCSVRRECLGCSHSTMQAWI